MPALALPARARPFALFASLATFALLATAGARPAAAAYRLHAPEIIDLNGVATTFRMAAGDVDGDGIPELALFGADRRIHVFQRISGSWNEVYTSTTGMNVTNPPNVSPTVRFTNVFAVAPGAGYNTGQFLFNCQAPGTEIVSIRRTMAGVWSEQVVFGPMYFIANNGAFSLPALLPGGGFATPAWRLAVPGGDPFDPPLRIYLPRFGDTSSYATIVYNSDAIGYCEQVGSDVPDAAPGDFNGDGTNELAVLRLTRLFVTSTTSAPYGATSGCWSGFIKLSLPSPTYHVQLAAVHLDGNATMDLLIRDVNGSVHRLRGTAGPLGVFDTATVATSVPGGSTSSDMATGDLDGDGDTDAVISYSSPPGYEVLKNNGSGTFTSTWVPLDAGNGAVPAIALADADGDGRLDLVLAEPNAVRARLLILPGRGDGTFGLPSGNGLTGIAPTVIVAGDFDGDGRPDLAIGGQDANTGDGAQDIQVFHNTGGGAFGFTQAVNVPFANYYAGIRRMVAYHSYPPDPEDPLNLAILQYDGEGYAAGNGDGTFNAPGFSHNFNGTWTGLARADLDGDDIADIIEVQIDTGGGSSTLHVDNSSIYSDIPLPGEQAGAAVVDWNGDGTPDIVTLNRTSNQLEVRLQSPTTPMDFSAPALTYPLGIDALIYDDHAAPFLLLPATGGGTCTVVVRGTDHTTGDIRLQMVRNQSPYVGEIFDVSSSPAGQPMALAVGDVNGDGYRDLLVAEVSFSAPESYVTVLGGYGTSPLQFSRIETFLYPSQTINDLAVADISGDGFDDLVTLSDAGINPALANESHRSRPASGQIAGGSFVSVLAMLDPPPITGVGDGPKASQLADGALALAIAPNPLRGGAGRMSFVLPGAAHVTAELIDVSGRRVRRLLDEDRAAGPASVRFDAIDEAGARLGAGVYFVRLRAGVASQTRSVVLMR